MHVALADHARRRRDALAQAAHPTVWRSSLALNGARADVGAPVRVGIAVGLALVVGGLTGYRDVAGLAALGALISAFCRPDPYRVRVGRLAVLGVGITASVGVGALLGLAGASTMVEIVVISVLGSMAALLLGTLRIVGPGAVVFVFAATGAMGFAAAGGDLARGLIATVLGGICGALASLAPWLWQGVRSLVRPSIDATAEGAHAAPHYETIWTTLRRRPRHELVANSIRIFVAMTVSAAVATAAGFSHPMWAAMGAVAAMQGVAYHVTVQRGVQRLLGNVAGAVIAAVLLGVGLGYWGAVVVIVICQIAAETWATVNYAITSTVVTPMALLLTALSAGLSPAAAFDRVADTVIGVVVGVLVAALTIARGEVGDGGKVADHHIVGRAA